MSHKPLSCLLLSGGLDSYTAGAIAQADGYELYALTIRYGQVHAREIEAARQVAAALGVARHLELDVPLSKIGGSALVGDGAIPKDRAARRASDIPSTYVPARNTVFLSLAMAWAEVLGAEAIVIGVNALDYSGYPDCRPEYLRAFERLAALATKAGVEGRPLTILAPLLELTKADIIRRGLALGVDYGLTLSCYDPGPDGRPCGHCDSCRLRARGFAEAGAADPAADSCGSGIGRGITRNYADSKSDMTERLYYTDSYLREFDAERRRARRRTRGRPRSCSTGRRSIRPPAASRSTPGRFGDVQRPRRRRHGRRADPARRRSRAGRRRGSAGRSTGRGASITCSSTPGSTCCRRRSTGCSKARTESFHLGADYSTIDLARELSAGRDRARRRTRPTASSGRIGRSRSASPGRTRSRRSALRKEPKREGTLRLIDVAGLRPVGVRRHARGAHRGHRHHRGRRDGTVPRRIAGHVPVRRARARRLSDRCGTPWPAACAPCRCCPPSCRPRSSGCRRRARICASRSRISRRRLAVQEADALADGAEAVPGAEQAGWSRRRSPGWDAAGLKTIAARIVERPGHVVFLVGEPAPAAARRRARRPASRTTPGAFSAAGRAARRQGRRPSRARPGRRRHAPAASDVLQSARELVS